MRADGTDVRQVSPSDVDEGYVSWTADSRALVYDSFRDGSPEIYRDGEREAFEIWIMNIDGSDLRKLTDTGTSNLYPSFEPRGS